MRRGSVGVMGTRRARFYAPVVAGLILAALFPGGSAAAGVDHQVVAAGSRTIRTTPQAGYKKVQAQFIPRVVEASAGDTVTWANYDTDGGWHDIVTYAGDASVTTGILDPGESVTWEYPGGAVYYRCKSHSSLDRFYYGGGYYDDYLVCHGMCGEITDKKTPPAKPVLLTPSSGEMALPSGPAGPGTTYAPRVTFMVSGTAEPWTLVTVEGLPGEALAKADGTWSFYSSAPPGSHRWTATAAHPNGLVSEPSDEVIEVTVPEPTADRVVTFSPPPSNGAPASLSPQYLQASPGETIMFKGSTGDSFLATQVGGDAYFMHLRDYHHYPNHGYYKVTFPGGTASYEICTVRPVVMSDDSPVGECTYGGITDRTGPVSPITISTPQPGSWVRFDSYTARPQYRFSGVAEPGTRVILMEDAVDVTVWDVFADASGNWSAWADLDGIGTKTVTATSTRPMDGESSSTSVTFRIVHTPGRVGSVSARPGTGTGQIAVSWDPVPGDDTVTSYRVYGRENTISPRTLVAEVASDVRSVVHSGLPHGKKMYYTVLAINFVGQSNEEPVEVQGSAPPFTPASVKASPGPQAGQVSVSWNPPSIGASEVSSYRVYSRAAGQAFSLTAELPASARGHVTEGVPTGESRYYKVSAVSATGEGVLSAEVNAKPPVPPAAPRDLSASSTAALGKVRLSWSAPSTNGGSPITAYRVYRGASSSDKSFLYQVGLVSTFTDSTCPFLTICFYHVTAVNALGEGAASNEASAIPLRTP